MLGARKNHSISPIRSPFTANAVRNLNIKSRFALYKLMLTDVADGMRDYAVSVRILAEENTTIIDVQNTTANISAIAAGE